MGSQVFQIIYSFLRLVGSTAFKAPLCNKYFLVPAAIIHNPNKNQAVFPLPSFFY